MSATQREHVIQVLDTPAFEGETTGGVPVEPADKPSIGRCKAALALWVAAAVVGLLLVIGFITYLLLDGYSNAYSAAITGAASSSNASSPNAVPPRFNLTFHIKNPNKLSVYCVPSGTPANVSYDGAAIGAGTVPVFCAGQRDEREVMVPMWVVGAGAGDVTLPLALQTRGWPLDVVIQMPSGDGPHLVTCSVRVGHGLSPCAASNY